MKLRILTLTILLVGLNSLNSFAQDNGQKLIDEFFSRYENEGVEVAVDELYKTNPWTTRIQDAINNVKTQLARYNEELVGKYYGYEPIVTKQLGNSYVLHSYLVKFDRQPLRFTFQLYKPDKEWRLASFAFDDSYNDELEEAAKVYYMDLDK
ncbi:MAG: hypothetical protein RIC30_05030 [Marinoscillum sp.]|uniref:hypothetical protein n=1 Tax=Marinoscillum sp. TaxID=2024838 RepID=UPI003303A307